VYTVYSRPLKSFVLHPDRNTIFPPFRPGSNLCHSKQVKNEPVGASLYGVQVLSVLLPVISHYCTGPVLVLCHFLLLGMTDVSALPLCRMFDNLLVLDQNLSALNPDLRPSVSSVHVAPDQSDTITSCQRANIWNTGPSMGKCPDLPSYSQTLYPPRPAVSPLFSYREPILLP